MVRFATTARPSAFAELRQECETCRIGVGSHWQLCARCDRRLAVRCPACGVPLPPPGSLRCGHCGLPIEAAIPER